MILMKLKPTNMNESNIPTGSHFELNEMYSEQPTCGECGCDTDGEYPDCYECHDTLINQAITNCKNCED